MDLLEAVVHGELFRIGERDQPDGGGSYDFAWLNGPAGGTYGFTVGPFFDQVTATELVAQARQFVEAFYRPGGIGETDFPDHRPAFAEGDDPVYPPRLVELCDDRQHHMGCDEVEHQPDEAGGSDRGGDRA